MFDENPFRDYKNWLRQRKLEENYREVAAVGSVSGAIDPIQVPVPKTNEPPAERADIPKRGKHSGKATEEEMTKIRKEINDPNTSSKRLKELHHYVKYAGVDFTSADGTGHFDPHFPSHFHNEVGEMISNHPSMAPDPEDPENRPDSNADGLGWTSTR